MRGVKTKALRKMAYSVCPPDLPTCVYIKQPFKKQFLVGSKIRVLELHQFFLGRCKRAAYKNIKKIYKIGQRQGLTHA